MAAAAIGQAGPSPGSLPAGSLFGARAASHHEGPDVARCPSPGSCPLWVLVLIFSPCALRVRAYNSSPRLLAWETHAPTPTWFLTTAITSADGMVIQPCFRAVCAGLLSPSWPLTDSISPCHLYQLPFYLFSNCLPTKCFSSSLLPLLICSFKAQLKSHLFPKPSLLNLHLSKLLVS